MSIHSHVSISPQVVIIIYFIDVTAVFIVLEQKCWPLLLLLLNIIFFLV